MVLISTMIVSLAILNVMCSTLFEPIVCPFLASAFNLNIRASYVTAIGRHKSNIKK